MAIKKVREVALQLLMRIEKEGSFSHLIISQAIEKERILPQDENLLTEIVYGTIERKMTLDYYVSPFIKSQKRVADWVQMLLRMSIFQLEFLDKIPPYAVIHEAVEIAKKKGHRGIASFVNGVLRNVLRKGVPKVSDINDKIKRLSIETSHPEWLVSRWIKYYGYENTEKMCKTNVTRKSVCVRVNRLRTTREEVLQILQKEKIDATESSYVKDGIIIQKGNILKTNLLKEGLVTVQDQSSMLACVSLQVKPNMTVLDTCSAPGGKATYLGEIMQNKGTLYAHDLHKSKINLIISNANRLGLTNMKVKEKDARQLKEIYEAEAFDRIIVDAPCSGFGVIRTKPDIKYNKKVDDTYRLRNIQLEILKNIAPLLKENGKLVYSTCTVEVLENEEVIKTFLTNHQDFAVDESFINEMNSIVKGARITEYGVQLFPHSIESDGFFISRLCKKKQ